MRFGSHLPILMKLMEITSGPVLELGGGMYSTPFLHWACFRTKRFLHTFEDHQFYFDNIKQYERDFHKVEFVTDWASIDISGPWSVALVDHNPLGRRPVETRRLSHAEYIVFHDADDRSRKEFNYKGAFDTFKYSLLFNEVGAASMILSNTHDLKGFTLI